MCTFAIYINYWGDSASNSILRVFRGNTWIFFFFLEVIVYLVLRKICSQLLAHWGWDKMDTILQMTFSNEFSLMKMSGFVLKIQLILFHKVPINNIPALAQIMARPHPGTKPLTEWIMVSLTVHKCITGPQWVNGWVITYDKNIERHTAHTIVSWSNPKQ